DVCVYHDHDRYRMLDAIALANAYSTANGALLAKHLMAGDAGVLELLRGTLAGCFPYLWREGRTLSVSAGLKGINRFAPLILGAAQLSAWLCIISAMVP